jgi:hypothetical protein
MAAFDTAGESSRISEIITEQMVQVGHLNLNSSSNLTFFAGV